jgi:hypothetical protein
MNANLIVMLNEGGGDLCASEQHKQPDSQAVTRAIAKPS